MVQTVQKVANATKGWRVFATSAFVSLVAGAASLDWTQLLSPENAARVVSALAVVSMVARTWLGASASSSVPAVGTK